MNAKDLLKRYIKNVKDIQALESSLIALNKIQLSSLATDRDFIQSGNADLTGNFVAFKLDKETEIKTIIEEKEKECEKIFNLIMKLNNLDNFHVVVLRYCEGLQWEAISENLHISLRTCFRYHKKAIYEIQQFLDESDKEENNV